MGLGAVLVQLKAIPAMLFDWIWKQVSMTVTVTDDDPSFAWVKEWFLQQEFTKKIKRIDIKCNKNSLSALPAPGVHWFWQGMRLYRVVFKRAEDKQNGWSPKRAESFMFQTLGRDRKTIMMFLQHIEFAHQQMSAEAQLFVWHDSYWARMENFKARKLDSVILPHGDVEKTIQQIEWFLKAEDWYETLGVPYHLGCLFYGTPGTGKTSLISGLSDRLKMPIYLISLNELSDATLMNAVTSVTQESLVVLEDIDCMGQMKKRKKSQHSNKQDSPATPDDDGENETPWGVTLSGVLNILDGFKSPHGVIFVMTTNHAEKLDPALMRPGRVDYKLEFREAKIEQKIKLYNRFYNDHTEQQAIDFIMQNRGAKTMAELQMALMQRSHRIEAQIISIIPTMALEQMN